MSIKVENDHKPFTDHPIQIRAVFPSELHISANIMPSPEEDYGSLIYSISLGHSEYDKEKKEILVSIKFETNDEEDQPVSMKVEIHAVFRVNEDRFDIEKLSDWATGNAPFILYPYLREHVYGLTVRCGFRPFQLPLVEVPTFQMNDKKEM